jgi:hypothetical protein
MDPAGVYDDDHKNASEQGWNENEVEFNGAPRLPGLAVLRDVRDKINVKETEVRGRRNIQVKPKL